MTSADPADCDNPTDGTASTTAAASAENGDTAMDEDLAGVPGGVDGLEDPGL